MCNPASPGEGGRVEKVGVRDRKKKGLRLGIVKLHNTDFSIISEITSFQETEGPVEKKCGVVSIPSSLAPSHQHTFLVVYVYH